MKKYIYFNTDQNYWFDVAKKLYENKIAEPVFWLGADNHYEKASKLFGKNVVKSQSFVHRPYEFKDVNYVGENNDFFFSKNYLRAKDRCLKMMDRLDLYGVFHRLDREVYFHNLTIWTLKKIEESKPDILVTVESPHDHPKYIVYEICNYLGIPTYKFQNWMQSPLMYLQNMDNEKIIKLNKERDHELDKQTEADIQKFIYEVKERTNEYEPIYMKSFRENEEFLSRFLNFFKKDHMTNNLYTIYLDIRHNTGRLLLRKYNPINPFFLNYISRIWKNFFRRKHINKAALLAETEFDLDEDFVYFPLHFEPERTTTPDGNDFHDQFIALTKLRQIVPLNIKIVVKEHPTQLRKHFKKGILGRSPLFYKLIKNINGLKIINSAYNSQQLIKKSILVSSITGTVALESAILGVKALTFGSRYYDGCPNIFKWDEDITFDKINNAKIHSPETIESFLISKKRESSVIGFQNGTQRGYFKKYNTIEFENYQLEGIYDLLMILFEKSDILKKKKNHKEHTSPWSNLNRPFLIAEIGGNHEGSFVKAKEMLDLAINSGVDCVKFQIYSADSLVSKVESPQRHSHFKKFELSKEQHVELAKICNSKGVLYTSSIWSEDYLSWINPFVEFFKIGSGDLTAYPIIKSIVKTGKPIILSTGLSNIDEVLETVRYIQNLDSKYKNPSMLCLLQCTSMYPISKSDVHLNVMNKYRDLTSLSVGYSDHTEGINSLKIAACMGADILEFHFTDSKNNSDFRDHKVSLLKEEVIILKNYIDEMEIIKGKNEKELLKIELDNNHNISFRRGVYSKKLLKKGHIISEDDLVCLRPAVGTDARMFYDIINSEVIKEIKPFTSIRQEIDYKKKN